jgi:hypothetical protein
VRPDRAKVSAKDIASAALRKGKKPKEKWTTKSVGGSDLSWDPYGDKILVRYATEEEHKGFVKSGRYSPVVYKGSRDKAIWFATKGGAYDAGFAEDRPWRVTVQVQVTEDTSLINFESSAFRGEAEHPNEVIIKENERGAYGIGRKMIDKLDPQWEENT